MKNDVKTAQIALSISENKRFAAIGFALSLTELGVSTPDEKGLVKVGKDWFDSQLTIWKAVICKNSTILSLKNKFDASDEVKLCLAIADLILDQCGVVPAIYVSAQILKIGLERICNDPR